jgi:hypothetical protein
VEHRITLDKAFASPTSARQYPVLVRQIFSQLRMERPEKVGHRETYLVLGG